jgi:ribosomal protein S24E
MDVQVINERENPLFKRKEILVSVDYKGSSTPSRADLQKILAEQFKVGVDSLEIEKIMSEVGLSKGKVWINIWNDKKVPIYADMKKAAQPEAKKE